MAAVLRALGAGTSRVWSNMGQLSGRLQQTSRFVSHDASDKSEHWLTFQDPKILGCFQQVLSLKPNDMEANSLLRWLTTLQPLDLKNLPDPKSIQSLESICKVNGITFRLKHQSDSTSRRSILQIKGMQFDETLADRKMQNDHLRKCWGTILQALEALKPQPAQLPGADASAQEVRTWMIGNPQELQRITSLSLHDLDLTCVPKEIGLMTGLQGLFLSSNHLRSLPPDLLRGMTQLQNLSFEDNQLESLPRGLLDGLTGLQTLDFSHNKLCTLPPDLFRDQTQLRTLYLEWNHLTSLPKEIFKGLNALEQLLLSGNRDLLVACSDFSVRGNYIEFRDMMKDFFDYECKSSFAKFYQLAAGNTTAAAVKEAFNQLDKKIQKALLKAPNPIFRLASLATARSDADAQKHVRILNGALKKYVIASWSELTRDQKKGVYERLDSVTRDGGCKPVSGLPHGETDLFDRLHILWLIDEMAAVQREAEDSALAVKKVHNENLQQCWAPIQQALQALHPTPAGLPSVDAPAEVISTWMRANAALWRDLPCVPKEIESVPALKGL